MSDKVSDNAGCSTGCSTSTSVDLGIDLNIDVDASLQNLASTIDSPSSGPNPRPNSFVEYGLEPVTPLSEHSERNLIWVSLSLLEQVYALTEPVPHTERSRNTYEVQAHLLMGANSVVFEVQRLMEELAVRFNV